MTGNKHPQKAPTRIDLKALQDLADKAGFDLVPKGRLTTFTVQQALDPLRSGRPDYRDFIHRSMVHQMADFIQHERAIQITDVELPHGAIATRGVLTVVTPEPPPAPSSEEDPLS